MKKLLISSILTGLFSVIIVLIIFECNAQREQLNADHVDVFHSSNLDEERTLLVHLPLDYHNTDAHFPVIYALDATSHDQDVLRACTILRLAHHFPDVIIVGVVNEDRNKDLTPHYIPVKDDSDALGNGQRFLAFIKDEVIPFINARYRSSGYNMLSGHSRAGLFSFYAMLEEPELFDAHFCYSPAFFRGDQIIAQKLEQFLATNKTEPFVFMSLGEEENAKMKNGFDQIVRMLNLNDSSAARFHHEYTPHAHHGTNAFYSIPKALSIWNDQH